VDPSKGTLSPNSEAYCADEYKHASATCTDMPDADFKAFWHKLKDTHWIAFKHEKTCAHAMFQGECSNLDIKDKCCKSCTVAGGKKTMHTIENTVIDGTVCVDKDATDVSRALGQKGLSCGTLAAAKRCNSAKVREVCCAACREVCAFPNCLDVSEQELRRLVGNVEGEGGCPHAAAHGKCEHSSLYHKHCCASCLLHRDITK
jgi:hypothetical protein